MDHLLVRSFSFTGSDEPSFRIVVLVVMLIKSTGFVSKSCCAYVSSFFARKALFNGTPDFNL